LLRIEQLNSARGIIIQASFTRFACENFVLASRVHMSSEHIQENCEATPATASITRGDGFSIK
jgi:hypothetical protein